MLIERLKLMQKMSVLLPERFDQKALEKLLLQGNKTSDIILHALCLKTITQEELIASGRILLESGRYIEDGKEIKLTSRLAGNVLIGMLPSEGLLTEESPEELIYLKIQQYDNNLPPKLRKEANEFLRKNQLKELQARIVSLLLQGYISFYTKETEKPNQKEKETGLAIVDALALIPKFKEDFDHWSNAILEITTSVSGASIPFVFSNILRKLGLSSESGSDAFTVFSDLYKSDSGRKFVKEYFEGSLTNTGTGDRYVDLDESTLPIITDKFGNNPGWVELTVSKGVLMLGTLSRMKAIGLTPTWLTADLYGYEEVWEQNNWYHSVCDPNDPWKVLPFDETDPKDTKKRVDEAFRDEKYVGFVRGDFERPDFTGKVLNRWRSRSESKYPDVIRMTATIGVTAQSMTNMINT